MSYAARILTGVANSPTAVKFVQNAFASASGDLELALKYGHANTADVINGVKQFDKDFLIPDNPVKRSLIFFGEGIDMVAIERIGTGLQFSMSDEGLKKTFYGDTVVENLTALKRNVDEEIGYFVIGRFTAIKTELPPVYYPKDSKETCLMLDKFFGSKTAIITTHIRLSR